MKRRILLSEAGGALTNGTIESLLVSGRDYYLIGVSSDVYGLQLARTDERHLVPQADDPAFLPVLCEIIQQTGAEMVISQHDSVISALSPARYMFDLPVFLPDDNVVKRCQNKQASYEAWHNAGLRVPRSILIGDPKDLHYAFNELGPVIWIRETVGGYGKGALPTDDYEFAARWIDRLSGWGHFQAAEKLGKDSVTWLALYKDGELIVAQGRRRLYWKYGNRNLSGVTGITGVGETVSDPVVDDIAQRAIEAVDSRPHGIYSVDMTYARDGGPRPTEINIGRFFTTHRFFTAAGLNLPEMLVSLYFGEPIQPLPRRINPLEPGLLWVREMDSEPKLVRPGLVERYRHALAERLALVDGTPAVMA